jgi:hypothetical protein
VHDRKKDREVLHHNVIHLYQDWISRNGLLYINQREIKRNLQANNQ